MIQVYLRYEIMCSYNLIGSKSPAKHKIPLFLQIQIQNYNSMNSIKYSKKHNIQLKVKVPSKINKKYIQRLRTTPSVLKKTFETQVSQLVQQPECSSSQLTFSSMLTPDNHFKLRIGSQISTSRTVDSESVQVFLAELKLLAFNSKQCRENKQYLVKKQKHVDDLRLQRNQIEEQVQAKKIKFTQKLLEFNSAKLKKKKITQKKNRELATELQELNVRIKMLKMNKLYEKLKKQSFPVPQNRKSAPRNKPEMNSQIIHPFYYPVPMPMYFPYQPSTFYPLHSEYGPPNSVQTHHKYRDYSQQIIVNDSKRKVQSTRYKIKTEGNQQQELLTDSYIRRMMVNSGQPSRKSKTLDKLSSQGIKKQQSFNQSDSEKLKNRNPQKRSEEKTKPKNKPQPEISQFSSDDYQLKLAVSKQRKYVEQSPINRLQRQQSQCHTYKRHMLSSSKNCMESIEANRADRFKGEIKGVKRKLEPSFIKVFSDKSQQYSGCNNRYSDVKVVMSNNREQTPNQTLQYSSDQSKQLFQIKHQTIQSAVKIQIGESSKFKKNCSMILEQSDEGNSLQTTQNSFVVLKNSSQHQKPLVVTNSSKQKKISVIQEQEEQLSPIKKSSAKQTDQDKDQVQGDSFFSRFGLKSQSRKYQNIASLGSSKVEKGGKGHLQSKVSRLKQTITYKPLDSSRKDGDIKKSNTNSQIQQMNLSEESSCEDFNFVLRGQSNIVKHLKQNPILLKMNSPNPKGAQRNHSRFVDSSFSGQSNHESVNLSEKQQDYPNQSNPKRKVRN